MAKFGPKLRLKLTEPKFKPRTKLPKLLHRKRIMPAKPAMEPGMMKDFKRKPMFPKVKKLVL